MHSIHLTANNQSNSTFN